MGSSVYFERKYIPIRPVEEIVYEFVNIIKSIDINYEYENETTLYLWKNIRHNGIRVYISSAEKIEEVLGIYYREIFFDAVYDDNDCLNSDLLLEITVEYMKKYPDTLLFGECSNYMYYDKQDILSVLEKPFFKEWYYLTESHISPLIQYNDYFKMKTVKRKFALQFFVFIGEITEQKKSTATESLSAMRIDKCGCFTL